MPRVSPGRRYPPSASPIERSTSPPTSGRHRRSRRKCGWHSACASSDTKAASALARTPPTPLAKLSCCRCTSRESESPSAVDVTEIFLCNIRAHHGMDGCNESQPGRVHAGWYRRYSDGSSRVIESSATPDGRWMATTDANPIRYSHLWALFLFWIFVFLSSAHARVRARGCTHEARLPFADPLSSYVQVPR